jgi:hypothetical protein
MTFMAVCFFFEANAPLISNTGGLAQVNCLAYQHSVGLILKAG